jgi:Putative MetA-pathway of phenol degradation
MKMMMPALILLAVSGVPALAQKGDQMPSGAQEKDVFNLFHPTPRTLMRALVPDRPDKTESPYTVDAGHFQLEMDFANLISDRTEGVRTRTWNIAPINLKAGLCNRVDVQFLFDGYVNVRSNDRAAGGRTTESGFGDFTVRLKVNLWGDDGGPTAFALLPFVKFPTNTDGIGNDNVEGGVILPLAVKLPAGFDMGMETGLASLRNESDPGRHAEIVNSITFGHSLAGKLSGYGEFFSSLGTERHTSWVGTVDVGLEYALTEDIQLDCGCNFGITRSADDLNPFAGLSVRF